MRVVASTGFGRVAGVTSTTVERLTGVAPTSCPWRAYGDPVVSAAMTLRGRVDAGVVDVDQQLAVVVEAMDACASARASVEAFDRRTEREKREAEQRAAKARNGG